MIDTSSLSRFSNALRTMSRGLASAIAAKAAPVISDFAAKSFASSTDPYGVAWVPSVTGDTVKMRKTGALSRFIRYVAIGTKLRVSLGVPYAKYQIGRRPVYPRQGGALPAEYSDALKRIAIEEARDRVIGGSQ